MSSLKITALAGLTCLAAFLGYKYVTVDPPGYCRAQNRYITDEEFTKAVGILVEADMNRVLKAFPDGRVVSGKEKYLNWNKDWDAFNPRAKNCCTVHREEAHSTFTRMFGLQSIDVWIGPQSGILKFHFDVCGKLTDSDVGLPLANMNQITTIGVNHGL